MEVKAIYIKSSKNYLILQGKKNLSKYFLRFATQIIADYLTSESPHSNILFKKSLWFWRCFDAQCGISTQVVMDQWDGEWFIKKKNQRFPGQLEIGKKKEDTMLDK